MSDKTGWISDTTGFIDQGTPDCIASGVIGGFVSKGFGEG